MKHIETLNNYIASSYGDQDKMFANHAFDIEQASLAIIEANKNGIGFLEYIELHRTFLENNGCSEEHIEEQLDAVKDISSYFTND
jgi:hypothetical protein